MFAATLAETGSWKCGNTKTIILRAVIKIDFSENVPRFILVNTRKDS